jgi:hypothetical protein
VTAQRGTQAGLTRTQAGFNAASVGDGAHVACDAGDPSLAGLYSPVPSPDDDTFGVSVGESVGAGSVGAGVAVGVCVGVGVVVGTGVGVGVTWGVAALLGEGVAEGQLRAVGDGENGRADGTVTGLWLACTPDRFTGPEALPPELPELVGVGHGPGLDVLPGGCVPRAEPGPLLPARPDVAAVRPPPAAVPSALPPEPPAPGITDWALALPPFSTVELTWTSAARSGGTATAAAVIEAAAARPATRRTHPMPCGRKVAQSEAAQWACDAVAVRPATWRTHPAAGGRGIARSEADQRPVATASQVQAPARPARPTWTRRAARRAGRRSRQ